ncbi:MAG: nucleotidyltransferase [Desulfovibrionales bacterium]|nr:MAG: nucleotidyltransferase [Desulfovibrionales bacterium]
MDNHPRRIATAEKALATLTELIGRHPVDTVERDAAIQRFEYTFEAVWKAGRSYLLEVEGIDAASPKKVLRKLRAVGLLDDEQTALGLEMVDDRNLTSHTYHEGLAEGIYDKLVGYAELMDFCLKAMTRHTPCDPTNSKS